MPELPEVETIRRSLQSTIVGKKVKNIEVLKPKIFQGDPKEVIGRTILEVSRRGKMLVIALGRKTNSESLTSLTAQGISEELLIPRSTEIVLLIHFKLTGQLVWVQDRNRVTDKVILDHPIPFAGSQLPAKTTHVIFTINGGKLFYNDLRQFGWIKVISKSKLEILNKELGELGPEPFSKEFTTDYLSQIFSKTPKPVKLVLMDQEKIAGVGNIYANEALFEAGIKPTRQANSLKGEEIQKLKDSIVKVLEEGLKYGGSSAEDEAYIKPNGQPGEYQKHFRVYQQDGKKCPRCGGIIKRGELGGRGTFYCFGCQK